MPHRKYPTGRGFLFPNTLPNSLFDCSRDNQKTENYKRGSKKPDDSMGTLARFVFSAHNHALTPNLKMHQDVRSYGIETSEYQEYEACDGLFHSKLTG